MSVEERVKGTARFAFKSRRKAEENKKEKFTIYLFFTYGNKRLKYSSGIKLGFNDWDFKRQRVKNKNTIKYKDHFNQKLNDLESAVSDVYEKLKEESSSMSPQFLKNRLELKLKNQESAVKSQEKLTFSELIYQFIDYKEGSIADVTLRSYKQAKTHLLNFEKQLGRKIELDEIDSSFYKKFTEYLQKEKQFSKNTIGKHFKTIKTFMNYAVSEGYTNNQRFKSSDFKVTKETTTEIYLTEDEIQAFYEKDLSKYPKLSHARDIFLLGCYTGQRVSDYNSFLEDDIEEINGVHYFKIIQKKNKKRGRKVLCPITKEMWHIMNTRHNGKPPKRIPSKDLNDYIKQIGQMLEMDSLNREIKLEYTKGGKFHSIKEKRYNLIKSHTARRSFATNKYKAGMPVYDIMLFTGHTTEKEFYKYIRIKDEERASHIAQNGFFNI
ncbi:MAG: phage integrase SAM-like domain-containing protein [Mesonia sp.]|uniref:phage integrase SAM-like domain-containing protein n=1 Tax=Mesonia sp. TaxID=1960830 RepID=UPI003F9C1671